MNETAGLAQAVAARAATLAFDHVPSEVVERCKLHIIDSIGVALAAASGEFADGLVRAALRLGGGGTHAVIGRRERLALRDAVQVNAGLIHCLDFDDTHGPSVVHVSATALPVALAMAAERGASGRELLLAYLISVETSALVGACAGGAFHERGFHPTGVVNLFGAAVAAARLMKLDAPATAAGQGAALSFASGSLEFLDSGAWTKRLHPGWAGVGGITAAALAAEGLESPPLPYEGRHGLYNLYTNRPLPTGLADAQARFCQDWQIMVVGVKPLPACHYTHAFSDAALEIADQHAPDAAAIAEIVLRVPRGIVDVVCEPSARKRRPQGSYEAQFSLHYVVAATLVRGRFTLAELEAEAIADERTEMLMDCTRYEIDPDADFPRYFPGEVVVRMQDGRVFSASRAAHRGSDAAPLSADDILTKFRANASMAFGAERTEAVIEAVQALDRAPDTSALCAAVARPEQGLTNAGARA